MLNITSTKNEEDKKGEDAPKINETIDFALSYEERVNFEKCLTQNFLMKHGMDYFGKRDLIFIDLFGTKDVKNHTSAIIEWVCFTLFADFQIEDIYLKSIKNI